MIIMFAITATFHMKRNNFSHNFVGNVFHVVMILVVIATALSQKLIIIYIIFLN